MVRHAMTIIQRSTNHLNPNQIPVITVDQPLYAIAKQIQWRWPDIYGEDIYVIVLGGLHIEMAMYKMLGNWLEGSGWSQILVESHITTPGRAKFMIEGRHLTRTRWAHQVTAAALSVLKRNSYAKYCETLTDDDIRLSYEDWSRAQSDRHPCIGI